MVRLLSHRQLLGPLRDQHDIRPAERKRIRHHRTRYLNVLGFARHVAQQRTCGVGLLEMRGGRKHALLERHQRSGHLQGPSASRSIATRPRRSKPRTTVPGASARTASAWPIIPSPASTPRTGARRRAPARIRSSYFAETAESPSRRRSSSWTGRMARRRRSSRRSRLP